MMFNPFDPENSLLWVKVVQYLPPFMRGVGNILNSRIGLALIFLIGLNFGLGPKLDALIRSNEQTLAAFGQMKQTVERSHEMITRLVDRCEFPEPAAEMRGRTASLNR